MEKQQENDKYTLVVKFNKLAVINVTKGILVEFDKIPNNNKLLDLNNLPSNILKNPTLYLKDNNTKIYHEFDIENLSKIYYEFGIESVNKQLYTLELVSSINKFKEEVLKSCGIPPRYFDYSI